MTPDNESYLGDGLYASFDGYTICLRAPRETKDDVVYLEPIVLEAFFSYLTTIYKKETVLALLNKGSNKEAS